MVRRVVNKFIGTPGTMNELTVQSILQLIAGFIRLVHSHLVKWFPLILAFLARTFLNGDERSMFLVAFTMLPAIFFSGCILHTSVANERKAAVFSSTKSWLDHTDQVLYVFLTTAYRTYSLYVPIAYWALVAKQERLYHFSSTHMKIHCLNVALAVLDLLVADTPRIPWLYLLPCLSSLMIFLTSRATVLDAMNSGRHYLDLIFHCLLHAVAFAFVRWMVDVRIGTKTEKGADYDGDGEHDQNSGLEEENRPPWSEARKKII